MNPSIDARFFLQRPGFALQLNLQLPGRGVSAVFGPSGSGKSSFLRCLAGLERPQGNLTVAGGAWQDDERRIFLPPYRRQVGMVFQDAALFPHLTVQQNLAFAQQRRPRGHGVQEDGRLIELLGIGHLAQRLPDTLSGGEKQRVAIARALFSAPQVLLMDEPLASLDQQRKDELLPYLERLQGELQIPLVYVSHSTHEVARLADYLVLLHEGAVVAAGPASELFPRIDLPYAREEDAFTLLQGVVREQDATDFLTRVGIGSHPDPHSGSHPGTHSDSHSLWVRHIERPVGSPVRLRVLARDVSIALHERHHSSILNALKATVGAITEVRPGQLMVQLHLSEPERPASLSIAARITTRSARVLGLQLGMAVYAQIKGVAPLE